MTDTSPNGRDRHTVSAFDDDLRELRGLVSEMGGLAEAALDRALAALARRDDQAAAAVVAEDARIDELERCIGRQVAATIVRRSPVADDLREVLAAYRIAGLVERVGDYAKTVAKRVPKLDAALPPEPLKLFSSLGDGVRGLLRQALDAFAARDVEAAKAVCARDKEIDDLYNSLFLALLAQMMSEPRRVPEFSELLFAAKSLERVGDQATNLAELVYFASTGTQLPDRHATPKA